MKKTHSYKRGKCIGHKVNAEKEKKDALKDEIRQDLAREREDRRKAIETKRMEKERAQAED